MRLLCPPVQSPRSMSIMYFVKTYLSPIQFRDGGIIRCPLAKRLFANYPSVPKFPKLQSLAEATAGPSEEFLNYLSEMGFAPVLVAGRRHFTAR